ncbi:App1 family protein [Microbacterium sp. R86528]|uniref:App1 family protein n=1 Tax=Microbacterium sp. R86528 TaxID=3093864 RepID=UPI0037CA970B
MPENDAAPARKKALWFARLEYRLHAWRERRARARGKVPTITAFPGYGGGGSDTGWARVLGRAMIVPPLPTAESGELASVRGWRSFAAVPIGYAQVTVTIGGATHEVVTDRGGVLDAMLPAALEPGWQRFTMSVEGGEPVESRVFIVAPDIRFGVVSDVDDTVMVTALPRPLIAAWNSFVVDVHARQPVAGMAVLLGKVAQATPGTPMIYLSTGAWNVAPTLNQFLRRHLFPSGSLLLTDWGPTHDRWFRSGIAHKQENLRRLASEFPEVKWLLIGDDGQHDDAIYTEFANENPDKVAAVAIRRLSTAEAVLAGGRTAVNDHAAFEVPWLTESDGAGLLEQLESLGIIPR